MEMLTLHLADYVVFCTVLLFFLGIGVSFSCAKTGVQDYLHGNQKMMAFPLALSLAACFISVITVQGLPGEMYLYGMTSTFVLVSVWGSILALFTFLPLLYPLQLTSVYQYLEGRYRHSAPKIVAVALGTASMMSLACICIYNPAVTMETITRIPSWATIVVITTLCTCYTALGGFRAVVWSNALQVLIMFVVMLAICCMSVFNLSQKLSTDGWKMLKNENQFKTSLSADPRIRNTVWVNSLGLGVYQLSVFTLQPYMMRYTALQSLTKARIMSFLGIVMAAMVYVLSLLLGLLMLLHDSSDECLQPITSNITSSYQMVYYYVYNTLDYPGVTGIYIASVLCASLSTVSILHNGLLAIIWNDVLARCCQSLSEKRKTILLKMLALGIGGIILLQSLVLLWMPSFLYQMVCLVVTSCGGAVFGMFLVGAVFPFIGPWGATVGCIISSMVCVWMSTGAAIYNITWDAPVVPANHTCVANNIATSHASSFRVYSGLGFEQGPFHVSLDLINRSHPQAQCTLHDMYSISPYMYHVVGCCTTVILSLLISLIPALRQNDAHPKYLFPFVRWLTTSYTIIEGDVDGNHSNDTTAVKDPETEVEAQPEVVESLDVIESDTESNSSDDVFADSGSHQPEEVTIEANNNIHAYRRKPNPHDPALILANILTNAQKTGERDRLISNTRL